MATGSVTSRAVPLATVLILLTHAAAAQTSPQTPLAPGHDILAERVVPADPATAWEKMILALQTISPPGDLQQSRNLFEHPHGNARLDKASRKITTPTFRYFKILSAVFPPMERDYRDTYLISLTSVKSSATSTLVRIERKFEVHDAVKNTWVEADPAKERVGIPVDVLFATLEAQLAPPPAAPQSPGNIGTGTLSSETKTP